MKTTNGIVEEYTGSVAPAKQLSKIHSVQNFDKDTDFQLKQRRGGQQRYYNNAAYSNDDNGTGASRMKVNKSVESLKRIKQNHKGAAKQMRGVKIPKINSTNDLSKGMNFGHKFVKTKN